MRLILSDVVLVSKMKSYEKKFFSLSLVALKYASVKKGFNSKLNVMQTSVQQQQKLGLKNTCVQFMFAYQQRNLEKMLSFCDLNGTVEFISLGEAGKGKIGELGKAIWGGLIECFPDIDNTLDAAVAEDERSVRCQVVIRGTQAKDFADIKNKGKHFESDHIFIFHLNENNKIDYIRIQWNHDDFKRQLGM